MPVTATPNWLHHGVVTEAQVRETLAQPSGYTEPLLHAWRLKVKASA